MTPLRLGIVGSGSMARTRATAIAGSSRARLVAVAGRNRDTGNAFAAAFGCDYLPEVEMLLDRQDLDAVIICTHNAAHGAQANAALESGRHTLVEYPLALDGREAERAVACATRQRLVLQVGYDQEFLGPHEAILEALAARGRPLLLEVRVAWAGGTTPSPFRNARIGGSPAQAKSYYLYAALDWLDTSLTGATRHLQYDGLRDDGHYDAAVERIYGTAALPAGPETGVQLTWVVGPPAPGRQRIAIDLTWSDRALSSDGRTVLWRDAAGDHDLGVERRSWAAATQRRLDWFIDEIAAGAPDNAQAERARTASAILSG